MPRQVPSLLTFQLLAVFHFLSNYMKRGATNILRGLVSKVRMIPKLGSPGGHDIELVGDLASILSMIEGDLKSSGQPLHSKKPSRMARAADSFESMSMVAGVGFEPTTFRL